VSHLTPVDVEPQATVQVNDSEPISLGFGSEFCITITGSFSDGRKGP
jgi:hypothetical protein